MRAILVCAISVYTYDKTTVLLRTGTEIIVDIREMIAYSPDYPNYPFDISKNEYFILQ